MRATGISRRVDELGRIVIPCELRRNLDIAIKDTLEIFVEDDMIILRKYTPGCSHCGLISTSVALGKIKLCKDCRDKLSAGG